jgi:hypothetical protein
MSFLEYILRRIAAHFGRGTEKAATEELAASASLYRTRLVHQRKEPRLAQIEAIFTTRWLRLVGVTGGLMTLRLAMPYLMPKIKTRLYFLLRVPNAPSQSALRLPDPHSTP